MQVPLILLVEKRNEAWLPRQTPDRRNRKENYAKSIRSFIPYRILHSFIYSFQFLWSARKPPQAEILAEQESRKCLAEALEAAAAAAAAAAASSPSSADDSALADGFGLDEFVAAVANDPIHPMVGWVRIS
jgi:hypothetical protein